MRAMLLLLLGSSTSCGGGAVASGLPSDILYSSGISGGMPGSPTSSCVIRSDGSGVFSSTPSPYALSQDAGASATTSTQHIEPAKLEAIRRMFVACDFCHVISDDKSTVPDAASVGVSVNMKGVSCYVNLTTQTWPEPRKTACSEAMRAAEAAACRP